MPSRLLSYPKIAKGESRIKRKTEFHDRIAEPPPIFAYSAKISEIGGNAKFIGRMSNGIGFTVGTFGGIFSAGYRIGGCEVLYVRKLSVIFERFNRNARYEENDCACVPVSGVLLLGGARLYVGSRIGSGDSRRATVALETSRQFRPAGADRAFPGAGWYVRIRRFSERFGRFLVGGMDRLQQSRICRHEHGFVQSETGYGFACRS